MIETNKNYLGSSKDMAQHSFDAYEVNDEMHLYYECGHIAVKKVEKIRENPRAYLWTPYVMFIDNCEYNNSISKGKI